MRYSYLARDSSSKLRRGSIDAADPSEALQVLQQEGLTAVRLDAQEATPSRDGAGWLRARRVVTAEDRVSLLTELATLLGAGMSLADVLPDLSRGWRGTPLAPIIEALVATVRRGGTLSEGLSDARLALPGYVIALVKAGEASGDLGGVLRESARQLEAERRASQDVRTALIYPAVLIIVGFAAVLVIFLGVVPKFAGLVESSRAAVPDLSRWVIKTGVFMRAHIDILGSTMAALALILAYLATLASARRVAREALLVVPVVGDWLRQVEIGRWCLVLGSLLENRVPLMDAIALSSGTFGFRRFSDAVPAVAASVRKGESLASSLDRLDWFDSSRVNMVRTGERSGQLPQMLLATGAAQMEAASRLQRRIILLIEPAAILIIGSIIGLVMYAVMMAVVGLNSGVS